MATSIPLKEYRNWRFFEPNLEPYTEPTDHIADADKMDDNIIAGGFREHTRLHVASMAMQGILSNDTMFQYAIINNFRQPDGSYNRFSAVAQCALAYTDALIKEASKSDK